MVADPNIVENAGTNWCSLACRSIRIGNYKVLPKDKITITEKGVQIKVPSIINPSEVVTLNIVTKDILKVLVHFGKQMPLLETLRDEVRALKEEVRLWRAKACETELVMLEEHGKWQESAKLDNGMLRSKNVPSIGSNTGPNAVRRI